MVGSAEPINGVLCLKTTKMYVLLHETVGSTDPTDGVLDPATQETLVLLHEAEGSEDPINGILRPNALGRLCQPRRHGFVGPSGGGPFQSSWSSAVPGRCRENGECKAPM